MVKMSLMITIFGLFFSFSEKQIHQVGKFHHKKHCHYLSTYLFFFFFDVILVGMGIGNKWKANKIPHTLNEWAQYPSPFWEGYGLIWIAFVLPIIEIH